ncbi:MAG: hypothetical protein RMM98_03930 [Acidobacteriota bacterium]|nr:hypothetical protein [Blastocatellia bacterium]MDW8238739.1 hypothetical protein [Acidobacteriota bacterium]
MPSLKLQPREGPVGTEIKLIGTGFRPNVSYRIEFDGQWLKPGTTNNRGSFVTVFRVPPAPYGENNIIGVSQAAHQLAHATFKVLPEITRVEPAMLKPAETVTVSGTGFGREEALEICVNDRPVVFPSPVHARADGTFVASFTVTDEMISSTPIIIRVTGQQTGALAQTVLGQMNLR